VGWVCGAVVVVGEGPCLLSLSLALAPFPPLNQRFTQVWLAEWMGTQVAAKELLCLTDRVKADVSCKRQQRRAGGGDDDGAVSDSGSDR